MLQGNNLTKIFGKAQETRALDGVDIHVKKGEFIAVMGPSGSGKSTLLLVLSGTDRADAGDIRFGDIRLSTLSDDALSDLRRNTMGFVFQQSRLLKNLNLLDNLLLPRLRDSTDRDALTLRARRLMEATGIGGLEEREITEVSGGQLQRAGICRALLGEPDILFADEPTGALNTQTSEEIMDLIADIHKKGTAVFLVTHDPTVAARAQRVLFMKDGAIASELRFNPANPLPRRRTEIEEAMRNLGV